MRKQLESCGQDYPSRFATAEEIAEVEQLEVNHELAHRLIGGRAMEMYALQPQLDIEDPQPRLF
jgi:hypothetical protein